MSSETAGMTSGRFRRVSRARILDGHPLRVSFSAIVFMVSGYAVLTALLSLLFALIHETRILLAVWALLPGGLLGFVLLVLERSLGLMKNSMLPRVGSLLTAFSLFFLHIMGYLALSSLVVSYPLGYIMERSWRMEGMASDYSLFSVNFFIVFALLSWLRNMRTPPCRCF
jgi:hypothetical protein